MAIGSRINLGLPQFPEGVPTELFNQFFLLYQALRNLSSQFSELLGIDEANQDLWSQLSIDQTLYQGNMGRWYVQQYEALNFGECVSPILDAGVLKVRKANATDNTKPAIGFVSSSTHVSAIGQFCEVTIGIGLITGVAGMIEGTRYFLSTTDGVIVNVAPVAAGNIEQVVGIALASNRLLMNIDQAWIQH